MIIEEDAPGNVEVSFRSCDWVAILGMSAYGYKQTSCRLVNYVRLTPESGHSEGRRW